MRLLIIGPAISMLFAISLEPAPASIRGKFGKLKRDWRSMPDWASLLTPLANFSKPAPARTEMRLLRVFPSGIFFQSDPPGDLEGSVSKFPPGGAKNRKADKINSLLRESPEPAFYVSSPQ